MNGLLILIGATVLFAAPPSIPTTPAPIRTLLFARPFTLQEGFLFDWRQEKLLVKEGFLLVLEVDPDLVYPRQTLEPVLFVGDQTAQRLNVGYISGRVIAVVPHPGDLAHIWFGTPQFPEDVTAEIITGEKNLANDNSIIPISTGTVKTALERGGAPLLVSNFNTLLEEAARLIYLYAPDEDELAEILASQAK